DHQRKVFRAFTIGIDVDPVPTVVLGALAVAPCPMAPNDPPMGPLRISFFVVVGGFSSIPHSREELPKMDHADISIFRHLQSLCSLRLRTSAGHWNQVGL